jgi:hypothetical protein
MPIYNDAMDDGVIIPRQTPLMSSIGIGPKVTRAIDGATKEWLDEHPEATTTVMDGSVTTPKLADNSVTNDKMADGSVDHDNLVSGSVRSDTIEDGSVTTPKLANDAVTTPKIADNAITYAKINSSTIPTMTTDMRGIAKVGAGLAINGDAIELDGTGDIATAVQSWLDAHPEATTTVEDGSLTPEKATQVFASQFNGYKTMASRVLGISDALYVLLKRTGQSTPVDDTSPTRLRIIFAVNAPVYVEASDNTDICDGVTFVCSNNVPAAIKTNAALAIIPASNTFGTKKVCGVLPAGFITVSMRKINNAVISDEDKQTMLNGLSLSLYELPTDEPTDGDVSSAKWQQYLTMDGDGNYSASNSAHTVFAHESFYRITKGSKFISWHSKDSSRGFGVRLYDKDFNFLGNGGANAAIDNTCNVLAKDNQYLEKDAAYAKFLFNAWDGVESLDDMLVTINTVPYERDLKADGISVKAKLWESGTTMTVIPSFPVIAGHRYRAYVKSDIPLRADGYSQVGIGYNGNFPNGSVSNDDIMRGLYFEMVASTTHPKSRLYINPRSDVSGAGAIIEAWIADITDPSTITRHELQDQDLQKVATIQKDGTRDGNFDSMLTIIHVSDVHGDDVRHQSMVEFARKLAVNDETVVIVNTGDTVRYDGRDGTEFINDSYNSKYGIRYLVTVGNHEAFNTRNVGPVTEEYMRQNLINPLAEDSGYAIQSDKTYYYVDIPSHGIRFIVLNFYEGFVNASTSMTQGQLDWFCSTLLSTPAGYGVIVCAHAPFLNVNKVNGHDEFYQDTLIWRWDIMGYPQLAQVVDAFIDGTQYSGTIGGHQVSADFSGKNQGVEFLAWLNGHEHCDRIGYYDKSDATTPLTHDQLVMNVTCTNSWLDLNGADLTYNTTDYQYFNEISDIPRKSSSPTENAFNVYCFDRTRKVARVARIGSDMTYDLKERKVMEIPYSTI